jgi:HopA1 effector protein family
VLVPAPEAGAGPWPAWARAQLLEAVSFKERVGARGHGRALAAELYRGWYSAVVGRSVEFGRPNRPLVGTYRAAHAGSGSRILADGIALVDRHDAVGRDGWWRTWGDWWRPTDGRRHCVRVLLSPRPSAIAEFVGAVTAALLDASDPWLLACSTDLRRLSRSGSAVLYVPDVAALPAGLLALLRPLLLPTAPPLCLPIEPGAALAEFADNASSFGAHRCHLVSLALQRPAARLAPLETIADVFGCHGIDPAVPYREARD